MSDDTLQSRIADLERQVTELQKTSKADIDNRAAQISMTCDNCFRLKLTATDYPYCMHLGVGVSNLFYCKDWMPK